MTGMEAAADDPMFILSWGYWAPFAASLLVMALTGALLALRLTLPILGVSIIVAVLTALGFILLIVPAFMIYCAFVVAVPALVEERRGVFGSLQRSRDLTRGSRKRIFVILLVFWVLSFLISAALSAFNGFSTMGDFTALPNPLLGASVAAVSSALSSVIVAVSVSALYVELRTVKGRRHHERPRGGIRMNADDPRGDEAGGRQLMKSAAVIGGAPVRKANWICAAPPTPSESK
jgi:hypothetical protein